MRTDFAISRELFLLWTETINYVIQLSDSWGNGAWESVLYTDWVFLSGTGLKYKDTIPFISVHLIHTAF